MTRVGNATFWPALISPPGSAWDSRFGPVVLAVLTVDGVLSAVAGALLLPLYLGAIPFPVSALVSGLVNAALVWAAGHWTGSKGLAALPLWAWLATVAALTFGGPGGDIVFGGQGILAYSVLILLLLGAVPAAMVLRRMA
ncbi:hypothetical protein MCEMAEM6B_00938 [Mycobacteriaceae bacterium]